MSWKQAPTTRPNANIFVSYRRDDARGHAGWLAERLRERFGEERVFVDLRAIKPGVNFVRAIEQALDACGALVAVIGREWLEIKGGAGERRLDDPADFVRVEIATALKKGVPVIPVLVEGALMPRASDLPDDLKPLAEIQALEVSDQRWDYDVGQLVATLERVLGEKPAPPKRRASLLWVAVAAAVALTAVLALAFNFWPRPSTQGQASSQDNTPEPTPTVTNVAVPNINTVSQTPVPTPMAVAPPATVQASSILAKVTYDFSAVDLSETGKPPANLFKGMNLEIAAARAGSPAAANPPTGWDPAFLLKEKELHLSSTNQTCTRRDMPTVDTPRVEELCTFREFTGRLDAFADPRAWDGAVIEAKLHMFSKNRWLLKFSADLDERRRFKDYYKIPEDVLRNWQDSDVGVSPLPIMVKLEVFVNGQPAAEMKGWAASLWAHDEDVRGLRIVKFPVTKVGGVLTPVR